MVGWRLPVVSPPQFEGRTEIVDEQDELVQAKLINEAPPLLADHLISSLVCRGASPNSPLIPCGIPIMT